MLEFSNFFRGFAILEKVSLLGRGHRDDSLRDVFDGRAYCEK